MRARKFALPRLPPDISSAPSVLPTIAIGVGVAGPRDDASGRGVTSSLALHR